MTRHEDVRRPDDKYWQKRAGAGRSLEIAKSRRPAARPSRRPAIQGPLRPFFDRIRRRRGLPARVPATARSLTNREIPCKRRSRKEGGAPAAGWPNLIARPRRRRDSRLRLILNRAASGGELRIVLPAPPTIRRPRPTPRAPRLKRKEARAGHRSSSSGTSNLGQLGGGRWADCGLQFRESDRARRRLRDNPARGATGKRAPPEPAG